MNMTKRLIALSLFATVAYVPSPAFAQQEVNITTELIEVAARITTYMPQEASSTNVTSGEDIDCANRALDVGREAVDVLAITQGFRHALAIEVKLLAQAVKTLYGFRSAEYIAQQIADYYNSQNPSVDVGELLSKSGRDVVNQERVGECESLVTYTVDWTTVSPALEVHATGDCERERGVPGSYLEAYSVEGEIPLEFSVSGSGDEVDISFEVSTHGSWDVTAFCASSRR